MKQRRKFSPEFKREEVEITRGANLSIKQVAADLGIHEMRIALSPSSGKP